METVNASVLLQPRKPLTKEQLDDSDNDGVSRVDYHLNSLFASHLSNPDLTLEEIAEASRSAAAAAATAAKAARATAFEKAAAAAKAVAAAKSALDLIASFPNMKKHHAHVAADLSYSNSKDAELELASSKLQLSQGILSNASSNCEHRKDQCELPIALRERPDTEEHAIAKRMDFNGLGAELGSGRLIESKEEIQVTRKRGRPKSK